MGKDIGSEVYEVAVGGVNYRYGKPTLGAMNEVVAWARSEIIGRASRAIEDADLTGSAADRVMDAAVRRATSLGVGTEALGQFLAGAEGMARMLWACVKVKGDTTWESFRKAVLEAEGEEAEAIGRAIATLTNRGPQAAEPSNAAAG